MISDRSTRVLQWGALAGLLLVLPGCLLVGHMEHRVERQADGSALVSVRYIDLRSDGETDSALVYDLEVLLDSFASAGEGERLSPGERMLEKHIGLQGDTLVVEVLLHAPDLPAVEGFLIQEGLPTVIVPQGQWITWTNGAVSRWLEGSLRIQWSDTSSHLAFDIEPTYSTNGRSLAPLFRERGTPEG